MPAPPFGPNLDANVIAHAIAVQMVETSPTNKTKIPHWKKHGLEFGIDISNPARAEAEYEALIVRALHAPNAKTVIGVGPTQTRNLIIEMNVRELRPHADAVGKFTDNMFLKVQISPMDPEIIRRNEVIQGTAYRDKAAPVGEKQISSYDRELAQLTNPILEENRIGGLPTIQALSREADVRTKSKSLRAVRGLQYSPEQTAETDRILAERARIAQEAAAARDAAAVDREAEQIAGHEIRVPGRAGGIVGPAVVGTVVLVATGSPKEAAAATLETAVPGASTGFKDIRNADARFVDRTLDMLDTSTQTAATTAAIYTAASLPTTAGAAGPATVTGVAGAANFGVQVLKDVAYFTGAGDKPGLVGQAVEGAQTANANTDAEMALYRAVNPLHAVQSTIVASGGLRENLTPELKQSLWKFALSKPWDAERQLRHGGAFAHAMSREIIDPGANGEALRRILSPVMQKAGVTPEQYSKALESYATVLDAQHAMIVNTPDKQYAAAVRQSASILSGASSTPPTATPAPLRAADISAAVATGAALGVSAAKGAAQVKSNPVPQDPPQHKAKAPRQTLRTVHARHDEPIHHAHVSRSHYRQQIQPAVTHSLPPRPPTTSRPVEPNHPVHMQEVKYDKG